MKYIYHYCAFYQRPDMTLAFMDGLIDTNEEIMSVSRYIDIKSAIADKQGVPVHYALTLGSLSLLGRSTE